MNRLTNLYITSGKESYEFTPIGGGPGSRNIPNRNRYNHAKYLSDQFTKALLESEEQNKLVSSISKRDGIYLEFRGQEEYILVTKSLEDVRQNVRLCNVREIKGTKHATVYVPNNKKDFFLKKINNYREREGNKDLIESIENINLALLNALWTDKRPMPNENQEACEVWLTIYKNDTYEKVVKDFFELCEQLKISYSTDYIKFPERAIVGVIANRMALKELMLHSGKIAEFRKTSTPASFFIKHNDREEQKEWIKELLSRTEFSKNADISVCILDTGVSNGHPLVSPVLQDTDMHTVFLDGDVQDISQNGHGTAMAGITTYFNLEDSLSSNEKIEVNHKLESVRIIDEENPNDEKLYGAITSQAISLAEIENPKDKRVIVMAVTADVDVNADKNNKNRFRGDGKPSSWSAAIDSLALGIYEVESKDERLIIVSAGNTTIWEIEELDNYKEAVINHSVEDPAQSWNALTVGAYTEKTHHPGGIYSDYRPLVERGGYSPFTSSSVGWANRWPIKPDIVLEGGNLGYKEDAEDIKHSQFDEMSLLTTSNKYNQYGKYFTTFDMTSSATAQASYMAAKIMEHYPEIWPETVRALLIHSARWTSAMKMQIFGTTSLNNINKTRRRELLRTVGYGTPDLNAAIYSARNSVNLVVEDSLQPFVKKSSVVLNEMTLHEIPWPQEVLLGLGDMEVQMRVTLSYFIDPSPGEIGWEDKYRYPGCRLSFDVNTVNENKDDFLKRINKKMRDKEKGWRNHATGTSDRWFFGGNNRDVGSVHSDIWTGTAAELAENRYVAVYPGGGWWKERPHLNRYNSKVRYALIISLSTPEEEIDLYTSIQSIMTMNKREITIETKANISNDNSE